MKFGEKLSILRRKNGMSQEELAEKLNVTRQTISKWELDQTTPDMDKLREIAKEFEVTIDELLNEEEIKKDNTNNDPIKIEDDNSDTIESEKVSDYSENIKKDKGDKKITVVIVSIIVIFIVIFFLIPGIVSLILGIKFLKDPGNYVDGMMEKTVEMYDSLDNSGVLNEMMEKTAEMYDSLDNSGVFNEMIEKSSEMMDKMENKILTENSFKDIDVNKIEIRNDIKLKKDEIQNDQTTQLQTQEVQE